MLSTLDKNAVEAFLKLCKKEVERKNVLFLLKTEKLI